MDAPSEPDNRQEKNRTKRPAGNPGQPEDRVSRTVPQDKAEEESSAGGSGIDQPMKRLTDELAKALPEGAADHDAVLEEECEAEQSIPTERGYRAKTEREELEAPAIQKRNQEQKGTQAQRKGKSNAQE